MLSLSLCIEDTFSIPPYIMHRWIPAMEKASSRIPKLTFGFRKSTKTNGTLSEGNTPRGGGGGKAGPGARPTTPTAPASAPGSNSSSPNLSRSKSLRVPRSSGYHLKSHSNSSLLECDDDDRGHSNSLSSHSSSSVLERSHIHNSSSGDSMSSLGGRGGTAATEESSFLRRPRSRTIGSRVRPPPTQRHSRSMSPGAILGERDGEGAGLANGEEDHVDSFEVRIVTVQSSRKCSGWGFNLKNTVHGLNWGI